VRAALLLLVLSQVTRAADPAGATPCKPLSPSSQSAAQLREEVIRARLAAIEHWSKADGESLAAEGCEKVYWSAYIRLVELDDDAAAKAAAALLLNPRLMWDAGDALTAADITARLGSRVRPYLMKEIDTSPLAKLTVDCINEGRKTCM
jgi:hypothetical protein